MLRSGLSSAASKSFTYPSREFIFLNIFQAVVKYMLHKTCYFTYLSVQFSSTKYIHSDVWPSPLCIPRTSALS